MYGKINEPVFLELTCLYQKKTAAPDEKRHMKTVYERAKRFQYGGKFRDKRIRMAKNDQQTADHLSKGYEGQIGFHNRTIHFDMSLSPSISPEVSRQSMASMFERSCAGRFTPAITTDFGNASRM